MGGRINKRFDLHCILHGKSHSTYFLYKNEDRDEFSFILERSKIEIKSTFARKIHREGQGFKDSFSKKGNEPEGYAPVQVKLIQLMLT